MIRYTSCESIFHHASDAFLTDTLETGTLPKAAFINPFWILCFQKSFPEAPVSGTFLFPEGARLTKPGSTVFGNFMACSLN